MASLVIDNHLNNNSGGPSTTTLPNILTEVSTTIIKHFQQNRDNNNMGMSNKYSTVKLIGSGGEAKALLVKKNGTDQLFVIKQRNFTNLEQANEGLNEAMSLAKIQNNHIVKFEEVFLTNNGINYSLCIVMEYCDGGDLMDFMVNALTGSKNNQHNLNDTIQTSMKNSSSNYELSNSENSTPPIITTTTPYTLKSNQSILSTHLYGGISQRPSTLVDDDWDDDESSPPYTSSSSTTTSTSTTSSSMPQSIMSPPIPSSSVSSSLSPPIPSSSFLTISSSSSNKITNSNSISSSSVLNRSDDVSMSPLSSPTSRYSLEQPMAYTPPNEKQKKRRSWFKSHRKAQSRDSALEDHSRQSSFINTPASPPSLSTVAERTIERILVPKKILYNWIHQLCLGVQAIHSAHLIHRDLKSENIFLSNYHVKIGDFGLATTYSENPIVGIAGTYCYSSPEVLNNAPYSRSADIFSLGCIIYEMTTLHLLPISRRRIAEELIHSTFDSKSFLREFPIEHFQVGELVLKMLDINPDVRPTIDLILQHKIFERFRTVSINASMASLSPELSAASSSPSPFPVACPLGGFRKQLDRSDLSAAAYILAEAYSHDPRFNWIKRRRNSSNGSGGAPATGGNGNSSPLNSSSSSVLSASSNNAFSPPPSNVYGGGSSSSSNSISDSPPPPPPPTNYINPNRKSTILPPMDEIDEGFFIRKSFFDAALKIMYSERYILWGYYNSENSLRGVACYIAPDTKKRVPYTIMFLKVLSLLPKLGLRASKKIKELMDVIDLAMEKNGGDQQQYHLAYCGVAKDYRGKGIGQYLLAPVLEWCDFSNRTCKAIVLKQRSIPFFMKNGFQLANEMKGGNLPQGIDVIWVMERKSNPKHQQQFISTN